MPQAAYDQEPEYLIAGGLVFEPLTEPYLKSWGQEWRRKAPFRLDLFPSSIPPLRNGLPESFFSLVLPDPFTIGYQDCRFFSVDNVNGEKNQSSDRYFTRLLRKPQNGYHIFEFSGGDMTKKIVLSQVGKCQRQQNGYCKDMAFENDRRDPAKYNKIEYEKHPCIQYRRWQWPPFWEQASPLSLALNLPPPYGPIPSPPSN